MSKFLQFYLKTCAKRYLKRVNPKIIAITGSVGKTSTKEAIFSVLHEQFGDKVAKSEGNLNTETGVPLAILGFKQSPNNIFSWLPVVFAAFIKSFSYQSYDYLVLELAADKPGDIKYLTSFVKPFIGVVTTVGPSHLAAFGSIERIAEEKTSLLWVLPQDGWAVLNIDDENLRKASYGGRWQKITYAINQPADITATAIESDLKNGLPETKCEINGKESFSIISQTLGGRANIYAFLAATAVGKIFSIEKSKIKSGLEKVQPEKHRMQVFKGINGSTIIDDSYNANPLSMKAALNTLANLKAKRKIAVIGDMREIGKITNDAHKEMGDLARKSASLVVAIGDAAKKYNGQKYFKKREKAIDYLLKEVRQGDIILVKASRSIGLDKIVEALKNNF